MTSKQLLKNPKCQHHWPIPASFPWLRETQAPDFALLGSAPPNVEQFQGFNSQKLLLRCSQCWNIANYVAAIVKADGCHCQRRWLPCESQRELLVQHLQPLDIVKEGGYNGGLLVAANNHCLMSKFGKFGNHHCWQRSKRSCHWSL